MILSDSGLRLDAAHFDLTVEDKMTALKESDIPLRPLADVTLDVFLPPSRQARVYVEDQQYGVPFLQGNQLAHFVPTGLKYISRDWKKLDKFIIESGWLLLTRSGTVGNVAICPDEWDGWAASEHVFRIIPDNKQCPAGYLFCCLTSELVQMQVSRQIYGGQVDELTEDEVRGLLIPFLSKPEMQVIHQAVQKAMKARSEAVAAFMRSSSRLASGLAKRDG